MTGGKGVYSKLEPSAQFNCPSPEDTDVPVRIASFNANGVARHGQECLSFFERHRLDVMFIQDARVSLSTPINIRSFSNSKVRCDFIRQQDPYFSQAVLSRRELLLSIHNCIEKQCVSAEITFSRSTKTVIVVTSVYARP